MEARAANIANNLGRVVIDDDISPEVTGNYQVSSVDKEYLYEVLDGQRKDDHLAEILLYMSEQGFFDGIGWRGVIAWADGNDLE